MLLLNCCAYPFRAYPIGEYPCKTKSAAAIMLMIMNNLDPSVAQVRYCKRNLDSQAAANWQDISCICSHMKNLDIQALYTGAWFLPEIIELSSWYIASTTYVEKLVLLLPVSLEAHPSDSDAITNMSF